MVLNGIPNVHVYIDDIIIATDTWEQHLAALKLVLERVQNAGLTIKPKKCEIGMGTITFLGHQLGNGIIQPSLENLDKVIKSKRPETKRQVRAFLGLAGYYREFIPNYAEKTQPLTELTKKSKCNKVDWREEQEVAFQEVKTALSSTPILRAPDLSKEFILRTDASSTCTGAVLMQEHEGVLHPIMYASKQLQVREKN